LTANETITEQDLQLAEQLMGDLAQRSESAPRLDVDALALGNDLMLAALRRPGNFLERARQRVDKVHEVLARHRSDSGRTGWLSGLNESEARMHPTRGGLRSGLEGPGSASDEQCFHHLALWMSALERLFRVTGLPNYLTWSQDLAEASYQAFVYQTATGPRMHSKLSCDLRRTPSAETDPLDPLDGLVTYMRIHNTGGGFEEECADFSQILENTDISSREPQALGRMLRDAAELRPYPDMESLSSALVVLAVQGLADVASGLEESRQREPAGELALAWGLERVARTPRQRALLGNYRKLSEELIGDWSRESNRQSSEWMADRDLNEALLAGALLSRQQPRTLESSR